MALSLAEADVGITEYVSNLPGFTGILKHRFRDFQVREVDPQGRVARLTSLDMPTKEGPSSEGFDPARLAAARARVAAAFAALAGPENGALLEGMLGRILESYGIKGKEPEAASPPAATDADAAGGSTGAASGAGAAAGEEGTSTAPAAAAGAGAAASLPTTNHSAAAQTQKADSEAPGAATPQSGSEAKSAAAAVDATPAAAGGGGDCKPEAAAAANGAGDEGGGRASRGGEAGGGGPRGGVISVLLEPIASKDVRKAVHEFLRTTPELPPLRTETVMQQQPRPQQPPQQAQQPAGRGHGGAAAAAASGGSPGGRGGKRGAPDGAAAAGGGDERPSKWQKSGRGGGDGDGGRVPFGGRGRGAGGRGGGGGGVRQQRQEQAPPPQQQQGSSRIEVIFDPNDLSGGSGGGGGRGGGGRGRGRGGGGGGSRGSGGEWEGGSQRFLRFVLYKENMDTQVALSTVSRFAGIKAGGSSFGFAGTKDKRAVTCQFVTAFKLSPHRLAALKARLRGIHLGDFAYCDQGLKLGALAGNEFHLVIRDVRPAAEAAEAEMGAAGAAAAGDPLVSRVAAACDAVSRLGFINYFGLQRFGSGGAPTHEVGRALLQGEYDTAVKLVLTGRPDERADIAAARRLFFDKGDAKAALRGIPPHMLGERAVLGALARQQGPAAAMMSVPRTLRMMYLHAWQSYVWNAAASHRIRQYGHDKVVAGDLVLPREAAGGEGLLGGDGGGGGDAGDGEAEGTLAAEEAAEANGGADATPGNTDAGSAPQDPSAAAASAATTTTTAARRLSLIKVVSEADVAAGRYSVFDVVLPLPGTEVSYPEHETGAWMRKAAAEAGVDLDRPSAASSGNWELSFGSLSGDYRYLLHRPRGFKYGFKRYSDPNDDSLVHTDLELLQRGTSQQQAGAAAEQPDGPTGPGQGQRYVVSGAGPLLALDLRFQLPSSCYATMLLRDVMKASTSKSFHSGLSAAAPSSAAPPTAVVAADTAPAAPAEPTAPTATGGGPAPAADAAAQGPAGMEVDGAVNGAAATEAPAVEPVAAVTVSEPVVAGAEPAAAVVSEPAAAVVGPDGADTAMAT